MGISITLAFVTQQSKPATDGRSTPNGKKVQPIYSERQRREIIAIATRDLSAAIRSGDPHRIAAERSNASNALIAVTQYTWRGTEELHRMLYAPITSITYDKTTGEATIARRDPATGQKYTTTANNLTQQETRWAASAERRETPYKVIWTPCYKFSLLNVWEERGGLVDGTWIQDVTGTLEEAIECARATERANSNRITVAVVPRGSSTTPNFSPQKGLKRLDKTEEAHTND